MSAHPGRTRAAGGAGLAALAGFACAAAGLPAQVSVHAASFRADLTAPGEATVRLSYELRGVGEGTTVPLSVLDFGTAAVFDVQVDGSGEPVPLARTQGAARAGAAAVDGGAANEFTSPFAGDAVLHLFRRPDL